MIPCKSVSGLKTKVPSSHHICFSQQASLQGLKPALNHVRAFFCACCLQSSRHNGFFSYSFANNPRPLSSNVRLIFVFREDMTQVATFCYDRSMCSHSARLFNDVGKFSMFKINLSYFPSRDRLNFRWLFEDFDLKSNLMRFFENFLVLSVKKLKKVWMILPSLSCRGRAFPAESCRYSYHLPHVVTGCLFFFSTQAVFCCVRRLCVCFYT